MKKLKLQNLYANKCSLGGGGHLLSNTFLSFNVFKNKDGIF